MKNIKSVQRIASEELKCGMNKIWIDPSERERVTAVNSPDQIKDLIAENIIVRRPDIHNSRYRARLYAEGKAKGRHMGLGNRKGTKDARCPRRSIWMKSIRSMRSILKDMKNSGELNKEDYRKYRQQAKGYLFKNKNLMLDAIAKKKAEIARIQELNQQAQALGIDKSN